MAIVELIHPQSARKDIPVWSEFRMQPKEGPYEEDLPTELFIQQLRRVRSTSPNRLAFIVGAMNNLMDSQTGRMTKEAIALVKTTDRAATSCGYSCFHCFGLQDFGRYRVTSQQATLMDRLLVKRSNLFISLDTTPDSSNAPIETLYRLRLGGSVIALFKEDNPRPEYREWLSEQVQSGSHTNPLAVFLTYQDLDDLRQELTKIADYKYILSNPYGKAV